MFGWGEVETTPLAVIAQLPTSLLFVIVKISPSIPVILVAGSSDVQERQLMSILDGDALAACAGGAMSPAVRSAAILAMPSVRRKERENAMTNLLGRCTIT